jgi:hypothetical protein
MYIGLYVKYPLFMLDFNETWILTDFRKTLKYQISLKSVQWEPSSIRADGRMAGQTDMTMLTVAFRNFANAPTKKLIECDGPRFREKC